MQTQLYEFSCPECAQFGEKSSALGKTLKTVNMWLCKMVFGKPPLGGDERQQGDTGGNVEAGSHGFLHWQSVREGEYGCIC